MNASPAGFMVLATYRVEEGSTDTVQALLSRLAEASRAEPGNLSYEVAADPQECDAFVIVERYRTPEDFEVHRASEHFVSLSLEQIVPLLRGRVVRTFTVEPGS